MKNLSIYYKGAVAALALMLTATSCQNTGWHAGPMPDPTSMAVFFPQQDKYSYVIEADDSRFIPVTIKRAQNVDQEASIVLQSVINGEGITVPTTVQFAKGEKEVTFMIDCSAMASKTNGSVSITIPERYTTEYGAGSNSLVYDISVAGQWILLDDRVDYVFDDGSTFAGVEGIQGELYNLDGTTRFRLGHFMGSDYSVDFEFGDQSSSYPLLIPGKGTELVEVEGYTYWTLYDEATATYPQWSPDGSDVTIDELLVATDDYTNAFWDQRYLMLYCENYYSNGLTGQGWIYVYFSVPDGFDPFASAE